MTTLKQLGFLAIVVFVAASSASAQILYSTDFNAPLYSDGALIGQDGWVITGTSTVNPINVANTSTNGNVTLNTTGQDVNRPFTAQAAANVISITMNADINVASTTTAGDYFLHLSDGGAPPTLITDCTLDKEQEVQGRFS